MLAELVKKASLFHLLYKIDLDLAKQYQYKRCPFCNGPLHFANYERKPRGGPENIPDQYLIRHSLCCGKEGCRRRTLPPSCRFMGRRVYWACIILVVTALRQNGKPAFITGKLRMMFNISRKTINRWLAYFHEEFPVSRKWHNLRGRVNSVIKNNQLPGQLLTHFIENSPTPEKGLVNCLLFFASG